MSGSVRYHSTKIQATKSIGEVSELLRKYGARQFSQEWDGAGRTVGVRFNHPTPEAEFGFINVVLQPKTEVLASKLRKAHRIDDLDQVERVAWRQLKGILEGILMAVDTGMFTAGQVVCQRPRAASRCGMCSRASTAWTNSYSPRQWKPSSR